MPVGAREPERPEKPSERTGPAGSETTGSERPSRLLEQAARPDAPRLAPPPTGANYRSMLALQRAAGNAAVQSLMGRSGRPMDTATTTRMEDVFGENFSNVRLHTDEQAAQLAAGMGARAFTVSRDVAFGTGEYRPGTATGDVLLAHELAHVVQQRGAQPGRDGEPKAESPDLEQDADSATLHAAAALGHSSNSEKRTVVGRLLDTALPRLRSGLHVQRCSGAPDIPHVDAEKVEFHGSHAMSAFGADPKASNVWTPGCINHAVAYTRGDSPVIGATFRLSAPVPARTTISVRVKEGGAVRGQVDGVAPAGLSAAVTGLRLTGLSDSDKVRESSYRLDWEVSRDGKSWTGVGSTGTHTVYWLHGPPLIAPLRNHAVKKAVGYAAGAANAATAAAAIRSGLRSGLNYKPDDPINADPLTVYDDGVGICTDFGNLLTLLALSVGLKANTVMFWGGFQSQGKNVWVTLAGSLLSLTNVKSPHPPFNPPPTPLSPSGWAFTYHVISRIEGTLHDAALDRTGIDGEAIHAGKLVRLVELDGSTPPAAKRRKLYAAKVGRKAHTVTLTVRDYGQQIGSAEFGDVYPVGVPMGAPSPVEVPVVWVIAGGALPKGMKLNFNTGEIKGKTAETGSFPLSITVKGPVAYGSSIQGTFPVTLQVDT